ncbi:WhiB family transcriptional regulator [Streptomyces scopuliridis]|uniref:WhiB family transcriptional regulator n=1 Tax=Streptomyces scopuliridis TaxID=452529 RepID=UPI0036C4560F
MTVRMTATAARRTRRTVLQAAVNSGARCARQNLDPALFFRADSEGADSEGGEAVAWQARRAAAIGVCALCPVRAACEELALRDGDGDRATDDLVRGGVSGQNLAITREIRQADRITAATAADRDDEWQQLVELTVAARTEALKNPDRRSAGGPRKSAQSQAAQNRRIHSLTEQIRTIRTARRARTGWGAAA